MIPAVPRQVEVEREEDRDRQAARTNGTQPVAPPSGAAATPPAATPPARRPGRAHRLTHRTTGSPVASSAAPCSRAPPRRPPRRRARLPERGARHVLVEAEQPDRREGDDHRRAELEDREQREIEPAHPAVTSQSDMYEHAGIVPYAHPGISNAAAPARAAQASASSLDPGHEPVARGSAARLAVVADPWPRIWRSGARPRSGSG